MRHRIIGLGLLALVLGCGDNELGLDKRRPNMPPETTLSSGPSDSTDKTVYKVQLFWSGTDRDGTIDHYDFIMVDHPPIQDHIGGGPPEDPTRVAVTVPEPDDPRWIGTSATDSTFITLADTLRRSAEPDTTKGETSESVRRVPFERWHTFFVRAVDNEGMPDPSPDYRSFNSTNIAPRLWLLLPVKENQVFIGPPVIVFNWEGEDEVGDGTFKEPVASRYVNITSKVTVAGTPENGGYLSFPDSLYTLPERYRWTEWHRWDAEDGSGKIAVVKGLFPVGSFPDAGYYIFAAQAMDEGGAITPVFDWKSPSKNNVALVRVSGAVGPSLTVQEEFLGRNNFVGGSRPVQIDVAASQPLNFTWIADASQYGGRIVAYRYGWDLRDPDNDQEWDQNWCSTCKRSPTRSFTAGSHRFFVQVRDNAESITQAVFELNVHSVTLTRDLLWVDDTEFTTSDEPIEDARWLKVLGDVATAHGFSFDPNLDVFDSVANRHEAPPIGLVFDYKVVVWTNLSGPTRTSALRNLCQFFDPFAARNRNTAKSFNYINLYLANKGKLWINGYRPAQKSLWPQERAQNHTLDPVNVTQWDDPIEPHPPGVDSVGTVSLLYKMGIEMFDVGGGLDAQDRGGIDFYCQSVKRAVPAGSDRQVTESSVSVNHTHHVTILSADVEAPPAAGVTYDTDVVLDHKHTVHLSQEDLVQLSQGNTVTVVTSSSAVPQDHDHTFTLSDQLGLWGAPVLERGSTWAQPSSQPGGLTGRPNIEIYNMPGAMANQSPPLVPPLGISVAVYNYVSGPGSREDPSVNRFYPLTADNQPVFILAKGSVRDQGYSRAFCGFEPYLLSERSHRALAEFVLVKHFRLGQVAN